MRRSWPILILGVALAGALIWGYTQNRQRSQLALRAENSYQQAFHRLEAMVVDLEDGLARTLATGSPALQRQLLTDLRVFSNGAVESIAGLPLLNVPMERMDAFFNRMRDASDEYAFQLDHGQDLTPSQWSNLRELHGQAAILKTEMGTLAPEVAHGNIRWAQTERATHYAVDGAGQTPLTQAVTRLDGKLQPPGEVGAENLPPPLQRPKGHLGPQVSEQTAIARVARFLDLPPQGAPRYERPIDGNFPIYVVSAVKTNNVPVTAGVSQQGGHIIWMIDGRDVSQATLNKEQAVDRARQFLATNGLHGFTERFYDEYGDAGAIALVALVPERDGITYFNEIINVRVARDNGEILGYDATQYWVNHMDRPAQTPRLSAAEAAARISPRLQVANVRLGVMDVFRGREALVYKVRARLDGNEFDVFINALTGEEERIDRVETAGTPGQDAR